MRIHAWACHMRHCQLCEATCGTSCQQEATQPRDCQRVSHMQLASYTYRVHCSTGPSHAVQGLPAWSTTRGTVRRFASVVLRGEIAERLWLDCRFLLYKACV